MALPKIPLHTQALIGMVLGGIVGATLGKDAASLGDLTKYLIEAIKWVALPLLFTAILDTILSADIKKRSLLLLIGICTLNALGAVTIALILSNLFHAGTYLPLTPPPHLELSRADWFLELEQAFSKNRKATLLNGPTIAIVSAIGLGILLTVLKRFFKKKVGRVAGMIKHVLEGLFKIVEWISWFIPIAVFGSVAKGIGLYGFTLFQGLTAYFIVCFAGMFLHIALVYHTWIVYMAKIPFKKFWREAKHPAIYAFGINSSLATLPMTLRALRTLKISDSSSRTAACIGTNFNNDGILLYEVVAALFIAQAYGLHLSLGQQWIVASIAVVAALGVAGVPEAGIISLTLVLSAIGLPTEALAILMSIDWVLGRCRSVTNVLGDMTSAIAIEKLKKTAPFLSRIHPYSGRIRPKIKFHN